MPCSARGEKRVTAGYVRNLQALGLAWGCELGVNEVAMTMDYGLFTPRSGDMT